jgi:hypothetical protein
VADLYLADALAPAPQAAAIPATSAKSADTAAVQDVARYTGLYWNAATGVRRIVARDGKLLYSRRQDSESELSPLGGGRFVMLGVPDRVEVAFPPAAPGRPRTLQVAAGGGKPLLFEEVQPASLEPADLAAYAGTYTSAELDTTWVLAVEGDRLTLRPKRGPAMPLEPSFTDAFQGPAGMLRFQRDGKKKITGFVVGAGRARNLGFTKTPR